MSDPIDTLPPNPSGAHRRTMILILACVARLGPPPTTTGRLVVEWREEQVMHEMGIGRSTVDVRVYTSPTASWVEVQDWGQRWSAGPEPRRYPGFRRWSPLSIDQIAALEDHLVRSPLPAADPPEVRADHEGVVAWRLCVEGGQRCTTRDRSVWQAEGADAALFETLEGLRRLGVRGEVVRD